MEDYILLKGKFIFGPIFKSGWIEFYFEQIISQWNNVIRTCYRKIFNNRNINYLNFQKSIIKLNVFLKRAG